MSVKPTSSNLKFCFWSSCAIVPLLSLLGCSQAGNEYVEPPPPDVTFANPIEAPVTPFIQENGITEAAQEAEVRSRVRGFVQSIEFQPGQLVEKGAVLYRIEKDMYEAAVESATAAEASAVAAVGVAQAALKTAQAEVFKAAQDLRREEQLKTQNASSQAQYDAAASADAAAKAAIESADANIKSAEAQKSQATAALRKAALDLGYTTVHAEIGGRITKTNFKEGNLVDNGSHLATIVDDEQIFANFSVSDRAVLRFMKARQAALGGDVADDFDERDWRNTAVYLSREGDDGFRFEGTLDYVDQAGIQSQTGTLGLRAIFDNPNGSLLPGLFVQLRVPAADKSTLSMLVPERAVMRDQQGSYVLIIGEGDVVERRRIEVGQATGGWGIVMQGLDTNDRVIVEGIQFARPTTKVVPTEVKFEVDANKLMRGLSQPHNSMNEESTSDALQGESQGDASDAPPTGDTASPDQPTDE